MSLLSKILGRKGEERAARFLVGRGYKILDRNYHTPSGELDLVTLHEGVVVFVEVKTRTSDAFGAPELAVTPQKQRRIIKAALGCITHRKLHQVPCRFDVVAISEASEHEIELIQNAFEMDLARM